MNWTVVQRILGLLLMMFSVTMLPPIIVSLIDSDHDLAAEVRVRGDVAEGSDRDDGVGVARHDPIVTGGPEAGIDPCGT